MYITKKKPLLQSLCLIGLRNNTISRLEGSNNVSGKLDLKVV